YLYERLNILDSKVASLLTINTILMAAIALAATEDVRRGLPWLDILALGPSWIGVTVGLPWLLSTGLCLFISTVRWDHLKGTAETDTDEYARAIITETSARTLAYNRAVLAIGFALACAVA